MIAYAPYALGIFRRGGNSIVSMFSPVDDSLKLWLETRHTRTCPKCKQPFDVRDLNAERGGQTSLSPEKAKPRSNLSTITENPNQKYQALRRFTTHFLISCQKAHKMWTKGDQPIRLFKNQNRKHKKNLLSNKNQSLVISLGSQLSSRFLPKPE